MFNRAQHCTIADVKHAMPGHYLYYRNLFAVGVFFTTEVYDKIGHVSNTLFHSFVILIRGINV